MRQRLTTAARRIRRRAAGEDGYSLPEVLVAALILVIGIGGLLSVFVSAGKGSQTSSRQDIAAAVASQELESMRSYPYAALALNSAVPTTLPDGRLVNGGTQFQATSSTAEDLVSPITACGSSITTSCSPFAALSSGSMRGTGYKVYRVVSWADQSCPVGSAALTRLSNAVAALYAAVGTVEATLSTLNAGAGIQNSIAWAQTNVGNLLSQLLGLPLLKDLLTAVGSVQNDLNQFASLVSGSLPAGLQSELSKIQGDLSYLRSQNLIDSTGHLTITSLDLCHLPKLAVPDLTQFTNLATGLTDSQVGVETYLTSGANDVTAAGNFTISTPVGSVTPVHTSLSSDNTSIQASMSANGALSSGAISAVHSGLQELNTILNCVNNLAGCSMTGTHVQKRISVAVVLDSTRAGVGPQKAVWMSSLVSDPADGLL